MKLRSDTYKNSDFNSKLFALVLAIAFQQFMLALVTASDAIMLGVISQNPLSAASIAGQITFVYNLFLGAMSIGLSILVAQYYGKKDILSIEKVLAIALRITMTISFLFFLGTTIFPKHLMRIFTSDQILIESGIAYLRIVGITYLFCSMSQIYLCIMKNCGLAFKSMIISLVTVVLNISFNAIFILGLLGSPEMGIIGAAIATIMARLIELAWIIKEASKSQNIKIKLVYLIREDMALKKSFWRYNFPVLGNMLVWGGGFTMQSVIMGHLGSDAVAANSVTNIVKNIIACFCLGLGSGGGIIIGNELGAGCLETAKNYGRRLCVMSTISGVLSGVLLLVVIPIVFNLNTISNVCLLCVLIT